jgi:methylornithine synthase
LVRGERLLSRVEVGIMRKRGTSFSLEPILRKACRNIRLTKEEAIFLLGLRDRERLNALFQSARELRARNFGDKIFIYGFIYISTHCRNDCNFCFFRRSNTFCRRYRKEDVEILEAAARLAESGVNLIDLTLGEDPEIYGGDGDGFDSLLRLVERVKEATGLPIMVSPGAVPDQVLCELAEAGVSWYACYQETHHRDLFNRLRPGQSYDNRFRVKFLAHALGMLVEEGILRGVGEGVRDVAESLSAMHSLDADQVRAMTFIPQRGIPLGSSISPGFLKELVSIAVMRLTFPDRMIPASLDVVGLAGLEKRLEAGANVVTSIVPPGHGLSGVAESCLDIEEGNRTVESVAQTLEMSGLRTGSGSEYRSWIEDRRRKIRGRVSRIDVQCG